MTPTTKKKLLFLTRTALHSYLHLDINKLQTNSSLIWMKSLRISSHLLLLQCNKQPNSLRNQHKLWGDITGHMWILEMNLSKADKSRLETKCLLLNKLKSILLGTRCKLSTSTASSKAIIAQRCIGVWNLDQTVGNKQIILTNCSILNGSQSAEASNLIKLIHLVRVSLLTIFKIIISWQPKIRSLKILLFTANNAK